MPDLAVSEHCKVWSNLLHSPDQVPARVAELADAQDLKSCVLTDVRVQVPPRVLRFYRLKRSLGHLGHLPKNRLQYDWGFIWGWGWVCIGSVSMVLSSCNGKNSPMAHLETRNGWYRVVFQIKGERFAKSLSTKSEKSANACLALTLA